MPKTESKEALPIDALADMPDKKYKGTTGQKKEVKQMLTQMQSYEQKINLSQQHAIENAVKDKKTVKKYEDEITKMQQDYDQFREKDPKQLDLKIKEEIEFSVLRISEKRYEAEAKVEILTEALGERGKLIAELQK